MVEWFKDNGIFPKSAGPIEPSTLNKEDQYLCLLLQASIERIILVNREFRQRVGGPVIGS